MVAGLPKLYLAIARIVRKKVVRKEFQKVLSRKGARREDNPGWGIKSQGTAKPVPGGKIELWEGTF